MATAASRTFSLGSHMPVRAGIRLLSWSAGIADKFWVCRQTGTMKKCPSSVRSAPNSLATLSAPSADWISIKLTLEMMMDCTCARMTHAQPARIWSTLIKTKLTRTWKTDILKPSGRLSRSKANHKIQKRNYAKSVLNKKYKWSTPLAFTCQSAKSAQAILSRKIDSAPSVEHKGTSNMCLNDIP